MGGKSDVGDENEEITAFQRGPAQRRRAKPVSWTAARRKVFLTELAHSCNVTRAHRAAEMCNGSAYSVRQRDAEFARQWQAALELGYERLEMVLARRALEVLGELELDEREEPVTLALVGVGDAVGDAAAGRIEALVPGLRGDAGAWRVVGARVVRTRFAFGRDGGGGTRLWCGAGV